MEEITIEELEFLISEPSVPEDEKQWAREELESMKKKAEAKKPESKPKPTPKAKAKVSSKVTQVVKPATVGKTAPKVNVNPKLARQTVYKKLELIKITNEVYELAHDEVPEWEFEKKSDGKWHVQCKGADKKQFASLETAVDYVIQNVYKGELKKYVDEKKEAAKAAKERRESRKAQGKPVELSPTEVEKKSSKAVIDKIENKIDAGKSVSVDMKGVLNAMSDTVDELVALTKKSAAKVNPDAVRSLIKKLESLLDSNKMAKGGEVGSVIFETERELKELVNSDRKSISNINGVEFTEMYPILEVTNKHASYYDAKSQSNRFLYPPFNVTINKKMAQGGEVGLPASLKKRIEQANKYIKFALAKDIIGDTDFGSTLDHELVFDKLIEVKNQFVTVSYKDGGKDHKERFNTNQGYSVEELRYELTNIIKSIKKGAKNEGLTVPNFK